MISAIGKGGNPDVMAGVSKVCVNGNIERDFDIYFRYYFEKPKVIFTCDEKLKIMVQFCLKTLYQCSELSVSVFGHGSGALNGSFWGISVQKA